MIQRCPTIDFGFNEENSKTDKHDQEIEHPNNVRRPGMPIAEH